MNKFTQYNQLLTIKEVCGLFQVSRQTLHNWTKAGLIKAYKVVRKVYYKAAEIEEALKGVHDYHRPKTHRGKYE